MSRIQTRKFIAILAVMAWITISIVCTFIAFAWGDKDLLTLALSGVGSTVGVIVGFYFGKSTAIEGVRAEKDAVE